MVDTTTFKFYYSVDALLDTPITFTTNFDQEILSEFKHIGPLPTIVLTSDPNSIIDTETVTIFILLYDTTQLVDSCSWTQTAGPSSLSFSPAGQNSYTFSGGALVRGNYEFTVSQTLADSNSFLMSKSGTFTLQYNLTGTQTGYKFVFTSVSVFNISGVFTCGTIIMSGNVGTLGSTALCEHTNETNTITIYASQDHSLITGTNLELQGDFMFSEYCVQGELPTLEISLLPNISGHAELGVATTLSPILEGFNIASVPINSVTWTKNSGPVLSSFNVTDINGQTWEDLSLGDYNFSVNIELSHSWLLSANMVFQVFVTLLDSTFIGQRLNFVFDKEFLPFSTCGEMLTVDTLGILGTSPICSSQYLTNLEVWFDQDAGYSVNSESIHFLPTACLHGGPFPLDHDLPHLIIEYGGSYSTWEDRNLTGVATDIAGVTPSPTYTFTQDAGGAESLALNASETYQFFPRGSLISGTYNLQLRMDFPVEFKSLYRVATAVLEISAVINEVTQRGNEVIIILTWGILILGNPVNEPVDCELLLNPASNSLLDPSLCTHNRNILSIFVSNVSAVAAGDSIDLIDQGGYNTSLSFPMQYGLPYITLTGSGTYDVQSEILVSGEPGSAQGLSPIYTWTLLSGPQGIVFGDSLVQTFPVLQFRVGTYQLLLDMYIPNSNDYSSQAQATVNILTKFKTGRQLGNQFEIVLTWPLELDGNMVNEPIDCDIILESGNKTQISPIECNHNKNTIGIITGNSSTLGQSSIIHLRPLPGFSQEINYTVPNDLPKITISGGGTYSTYAAITLTVLPTDITGFLPTYTWTQVSGPETLILNGSFISQTFAPDAFSTGQYVFQVVMSLPSSSRGYTYKASSTISIQSAFMEGEQYGSKFRIYLTYAIWLSGSKYNSPLNCGDIVDAATMALLQPSLCTHDQQILTIYASNQSTGNTLILNSQSFFSEAISYTGTNGMPTLLAIARSGSDPWESSDSGNSLTTTNSECTGLQVEYTWEVISGNPLPQFINFLDSAIQFQPMSVPAGDYTIKCSLSVPGCLNYISTQTIAFSVKVNIYAQSQKGSIITIIMSGGFYLNNALEGDSTCSNILPVAFIAKMGSNPKCTHQGAMLRVFLSNNSAVAEGDSFDLQHVHFTTTLVSGVKPVPTLAISIPTSMDGKNQLRTKVMEIRSEVTMTEGTDYILIWSQNSEDQPSRIIFNNSELSQIIKEKLIKEGNYSVGIKVLFEKANNYELNEEVNFTYASMPTARIAGGMTAINYNMDLELTTYMSVDNDIGTFSPELQWTWEGSADPDFISPALMHNGQQFDPHNYQNKNLSFGEKELGFGGNYYFKLRVSKWEEFVGEATTKIMVYESGPAIKLRSGSIYRRMHNPMADLCVQSFGLSLEGLSIVNKWVVYPSPIAVESRGDKICILSKYLIPGAAYKITCKATETGTGRENRRLAETYSRSMTTTIPVSSFPVAKNVQITPKTGHGLTQIFTFNMENWYDEEGSQLKYMIMVKVVGSTTGFVALNSYTALQILTSFLPTGKYIYNYLVIVRIQAINEFGASVYKDTVVRVIEPENIYTDDPNKFLNEELFSLFESRSLPDKLYRMSCGTYFAQVSTIMINTSDACGGCGEMGECLVEIRECGCFEGYQGMHCEYSPQDLQRVYEVANNILGSNINI